MRPQLVLSLALLLGLLAAGCGSEGSAPRMARADVAPLIRLADRISHEGPCAQARDIRLLDRERAVLVSARRVPPALAGSFTSGVDALVAQMPVCVPPVARSTPPPPPPPAVTPPEHGDGEHGHGHGHRHGHGHGHHDKKSDEGG